MFRKRPSLLILLMFSAVLLFGTADGAWLAKVPASDHQKTNPYEGQPDAIAAGRKVFEEHCTKCHGQNAQGVKKRPSLRTERIQQQATVGDLHWLLVNGSMKRGMPSWAKLPDPQLWQLVTYLKSLHE
jgi:mono/diheme cytochrome c family protein